MKRGVAPIVSQSINTQLFGNCLSYLEYKIKCQKSLNQVYIFKLLWIIHSGTTDVKPICYYFTNMFFFFFFFSFEGDCSVSQHTTDQIQHLKSRQVNGSKAWQSGNSHRRQMLSG